MTLVSKELTFEDIPKLYPKLWPLFNKDGRHIFHNF